jgi:hypothetical protein
MTVRWQLWKMKARFDEQSFSPVFHHSGRVGLAAPLAAFAAAASAADLNMPSLLMCCMTSSASGVCALAASVDTIHSIACTSSAMCATSMSRTVRRIAGRSPASRWQPSSQTSTPACGARPVAHSSPCARSTPATSSSSMAVCSRRKAALNTALAEATEAAGRSAEAADAENIESSNGFTSGEAMNADDEAAEAEAESLTRDERLAAAGVAAADLGVAIGSCAARRASDRASTMT